MFFKVVLVSYLRSFRFYSRSLHFHINFWTRSSISILKVCWNFDCDCFEHRDQLEGKWILAILSSYPSILLIMRYISPFIYIFWHVLFYLKKNPTSYYLKYFGEKKNLLGDSPKNVIGELYCDTEFVEYLFFFSWFSIIFLVMCLWCFSLQEVISKTYLFLLSPFCLCQLHFPAVTFLFEIFPFFAQRLNTQL